MGGAQSRELVDFGYRVIAVQQKCSSDYEVFFDFIIKVDGEPVSKSESLSAMIQKHDSPDKDIVISLYNPRRGLFRDLSVEVPENEPVHLGVTVRYEAFDVVNREGLCVKSYIQPPIVLNNRERSAAEVLKLEQSYDWILGTTAGLTVSSPTDLKDALTPSSEILSKLIARNQKIINGIELTENDEIEEKVPSIGLYVFNLTQDRVREVYVDITSYELFPWGSPLNFNEMLGVILERRRIPRYFATPALSRSQSQNKLGQDATLAEDIQIVISPPTADSQPSGLSEWKPSDRLRTVSPTGERIKTLFTYLRADKSDNMLDFPQMFHYRDVVPDNLNWRSYGDGIGLMAYHIVEE